MQNLEVEVTTEDGEAWVLDTGSISHRTGCRIAFTDLNMVVLESMHFGDDSMARIEGRGSVVLECKNRERRLSRECTTFYASRPTS